MLCPLFADIAAHVAGACLQIIVAADLISLIVTALRSKIDGEKCHPQLKIKQSPLLADLASYVAVADWRLLLNEF